MRRVIVVLLTVILTATLVSGEAEAEDSYVVKRGDCLWDIAHRYGLSVEYLVAVNGIKYPSLLFPGQVLKVHFPKGDEIYSIATWYGRRYHGSIMANGEVYNMYDPSTCASNRWPLGTWLRVQYRSKIITVQVKDRGEFNHAIDLSNAAFSKLTNPNLGVIPVEITVLTE